MTDLTEQWKKSELQEETACYVRVNGDIYLGSIRYKNGCHNKKLPYVKSFNGQFITKYIEEILALVPSYEELQNQAKKETQRISLMIRLNDVNNNNHALEIENTKLKELLKECRSPINYALCCNLSEEEKIEFKNLLAKIKQVLGEE